MINFFENSFSGISSISSSLRSNIEMLSVPWCSHIDYLVPVSKFIFIICETIFFWFSLLMAFVFGTCLGVLPEFLLPLVGIQRCVLLCTREPLDSCTTPEHQYHFGTVALYCKPVGGHGGRAWPHPLLCLLPLWYDDISLLVGSWLHCMWLKCCLSSLILLCEVFLLICCCFFVPFLVHHSGPCNGGPFFVLVLS